MRVIAGIALSFALLWAQGAPAQSASPDFTVADIRVEGLQRISEGTVFTYLPINIGDRINRQRLQEATRDLYRTGFFRDIELRRDGNTLVVAVLERPSIENIELKGNKDIKTEDLEKAMRGQGLATGKTFNRSMLEELTRYLTDQYHARGKYAATIDPKVEDLSNNRVRLTIDIKEGDRAKIRRINLIGNKSFEEKEILESLTLRTPSWTTWYKQGDRYSSEALEGDLEKIQQFYQDRGYANYATESVQVSIAPDRKDVFITVSLDEGEVHKFGEVRVAGNSVVPLEQLQALVLVKQGQDYTQKGIADTEELIKNRLGLDGFYFAEVRSIPELDEQKKSVNLTLLVEPNNRVYVREIRFAGTTRSNDETLRRELRQLEGSLLSKPALERSKLRLQQQAFVEEVEYETDRVAGSDDLVDIEFNIKERSSATIGGGVGYSESQSFMLNGYFSDSNFMGSGDNVSLQIDSGRYQSIYSFTHTDPYRTPDGISRTVSLSFRDSSQFVSSSSQFRSRNVALGLNYGYPVTEYQRVSGGLSFQQVDLLTYAGSSAQQAVDWVRANGKPYTRDIISTFAQLDGTVISTSTPLYGSKFNAIELNLGWLFDSRNRALFADRGQRHSLGISAAPGKGSTVGSWVFNYDYTGYLPLGQRWTLAFGTNIAYGAGLGDSTGLPPYKRFYAGGPDSVRGFAEDTLGPVDSNGNPYGGNMLVTGRTELIVPMPRKFQSSARVSVFYDIGNVFSTDQTRFVGRDGQTPVDYKFKYDQLRQSAGVSLEWVAPALGMFRFSYGVPINKITDVGAAFSDQTESFQFTVGQSF